jgi:hypothetical protein
MATGARRWCILAASTEGIRFWPEGEAKTWTLQETSEGILMKNARLNPTSLLLPLLILSSGMVLTRTANAQNPELQQQVSSVQQSMAKNKQALASYTWNEQVTISLKGEEKKQEHFQVRLGPDLKPQKTSLDPPPDPPSGGRLKKHIVAKKTEEYQDYANQMKALAQQYVPPDKDLLQQAFAQENISLGAAGAPGEIQLVVHNYLKSGDSMIMVFDKTQKELLRIQIASYMDDPKDAMNLIVGFTRLPDGTSHVSNLAIDGVSKQLNIAIQNANYQHV